MLSGFDCSPLKVNLGSVLSMQLVRTDWVQSMRRITTHTLSSDPVTLNPDQNWIQYRFDLDTVSYRFTPQQTRHGTYYTLEVSISNRLLSPELEGELRELVDGHYLLKIIDANNYERMLGTLESPMRFSASGDTQTQRSAINASEWTFQGVSRFPGAFLGIATQQGVGYDIISDSLIVYA